MEKSTCISNLEGRNWRSELFVFLMNYRNTPHSSTGVSPATLRINRHIRTTIPYLDISRPSKLLQTACSNDNLRIWKAKEYADKWPKANPIWYSAGDQVPLLQKHTNKLTSKYDPKPFTVLRWKGVRVELARGEANCSGIYSWWRK